MTIARFIDKFDRVDGEVGPNYTIPCGAAALFDEAVVPVSPDGTDSGFLGSTNEKTQVLFTAQELDGSDYSSRVVWLHLGSVPNFMDIDQLMTLASEDPSITVLARMTKDPLLVDLGTDEQPECYDQGYGLRITCPRDGSAPILKLVKFSPRGIPPGIAGPQTSTEPDKARVLASVALTIDDLNVDPAQASDSTDPPLYRGFVQETRLRIRRTDGEVILEAFQNDRTRDTPLLTYTDRKHPVWGARGVPGFEFISATLASQPEGVSPFGLAALPVMMVHLFEAETVKDFAPSRVSAPDNRWTYERVASRVITLVEKNGDARYNATSDGQTKLATYLDFVYAAERKIIRDEGYWSWLERDRVLLLDDDVEAYDLPEEAEEIRAIWPESIGEQPIPEVTRDQFVQVAGPHGNTESGAPRFWMHMPRGTNDRLRVRFFPSGGGRSVRVAYFSRMIDPYDPAQQVPFVPQADIDVLIYSAAADALLLDTDSENAQLIRNESEARMEGLRRKNNRKHDSRQTTMEGPFDRVPERRYPPTRFETSGWRP